MSKAFLRRIEPSRSREKVIEWPFPVEGERPKLTMRVLGFDEIEVAHLAAVDHFKAIKRKIEETDSAFLAREALEKVFRAFKHEGEPIADSVDDLAKQPVSIVLELHSTWSSFQAEVAAVPLTQDDLNAVIAELKKNTSAAQLQGWPSSWLIGLITTLASRPVDSIPAKELG